MRILFITSREIEYPRNEILLGSFQSWADVDVIAPKWRGSLLADSLRSIVMSLPHILTKHYDLICTGFYGHLITIPVGLLSRDNLLFDAFVSTFDTLINDRQEFSPGSTLANLAWQVDKIACSLAKHILVDTQAHANYFSVEFGIPREKFSALFVGCNDHLFYPNPQLQENSQQVLYYSSYLPLHGVDIVVQAAKLLENQAKFRLIGGGKEFLRVRKLADSIQAKNVEFIPTIPLKDMPNEISRAAICLGGHFGASPKAARVIAGKTFQCLAMEKATIVGENPANHELLTHGKDAWFCAMNDPEDLAKSINTLLEDDCLRKRLATQARITYVTKASAPVLHAELKNLLEEHFHLFSSVPR